MVHWKDTLLYVCIIMRLSNSACDAQLLSFTTIGQMTDLAVSTGDQLFASEQNVVYRLNSSSLAMQETMRLTGGVSILGLSLTPDESTLVVCASDESCTVYDANNMNKGTSKVFGSVLASSDSVALMSTSDSGGGNSFYVGSSNGSGGVNLIGQYGVGGTASNVSRTSGDLFSVTASSFTRIWFEGFVAGSYAYFVVLDVNTSSTSEAGIRVLRVCNNSYENMIESMSEIELDCLGLAGRVNGYARLAGASLVTYPINGPSSYETTLLVGIVTPPLGSYSGMYHSRVCTYRLSQIDSMMDNASSPSPSYTCFSGPLPWWNKNDTSFSCSTSCNMSSPGAVEAPTLPAVSQPLSVPLINTSYELSYTLSIYLESTTLLFIASTNQAGDSILQGFHVVDGSASSAGRLFFSWMMPSQVIKLTWISGITFIYAVTNISIIKVPIEQCSTFTNCLSCAVNVNPLCGWCTVEQKCARRSQCQNGTASGLWVQGNTSQCSSTAVVTTVTTNNPNYTSVYPTNTINSGGITLTFYGTYLNTTEKAIFVLINGYTSECDNTFSTVTCIVPPINLDPFDLLFGPVYLVPGVDYTILMGDAPGPVGDNLQIEVDPDPFFQSIAENDQTQFVGFVKPIRINGFYITDVNVHKEITVTVGGEKCDIDVEATTSTVLTCQPPQFSSTVSSYDALVVVSVGIYLNSTPGNITLLVTSMSTPGTLPVAAVAGGVVGSVSVLFLLTVVVGTILVAHHRGSLKKKNRIRQLMSQLMLKQEGTNRGPCDMQDFMSQYTGTIIPSDQIHVLNTIGNGEFGVVYKAHFIHGNPLTLEVVAIKTLKGLFTLSDLSGMMNEILKMQDFHHPHVMTLIGMCFDATNTPSMVMPFMANGSLLSYLKKNRPLLLIHDAEDEEKELHISQKLLTKACYQVAQGMEYLAAKKFVHRDLAARNCMLDEDGVIKVGDFGLSEDVYVTGYFRLDKGSPGVKLPLKWLALESIQDGVFNEKTDVWAFGVTCWEIFTLGNIPYPGIDSCDLLILLKKGRRLEKPENAACSETMYSLMLRCWDADPEDRPSFTKIAQTISKSLQIMSEYLDLSMVQAVNAQDGNNELIEVSVVVKDVQTSECEACQMKHTHDYVNQIQTVEAAEGFVNELALASSPRYVDDASGGFVNPLEEVVEDRYVLANEVLSK